MAQKRLEKYAFTWKGEYKGDVGYEYIDGVYHNSGIHVCKKPCKGIDPPNAEYWDTMLLSATLVDRQAAEAAATTAGQHKDAAAASAQGAAGSATLAGQHKDAAVGSAQAAASSATTAGQHKDAAAGSAQAAKTSETNAAASATAAQEAAASVDGEALLAALAGKVSKSGDTMTGTLIVPEVVEDGVSLADKYTRNDNLLDNADMRNPVNQRGVSGTISTLGYFLDRWILDAGTVTLGGNPAQGTGFLTMAPGSKVTQKIDKLQYGGKQVTVSVLDTAGNAHYGTGIIPATPGTVTVDMPGFGSCVFGNATNLDPPVLYYTFNCTGGGNIVCFAVEPGDKCTIKNAVPVKRAAQKLICEQQYRVINGIMVQGIGSTRVSGFMFGGAMRAIGTVTIYPGGSNIDYTRPNQLTPYGDHANGLSVTSLGNLSDCGVGFINISGGATAGAWYRCCAVVDASL